jgi:ankyrin repeat protein
MPKKLTEVEKAMQSNDYAKVESLVAAGTKLKTAEANEWLWYALFTSPAAPDLRAAKLALKAGADPNYESDITQGGNQTDYLTLLSTAAATGHLDTVKFLLEAGANPNAPSYTVSDYWEQDQDPEDEEPEKENQKSPLQFAAEEGKQEVYNLLHPLTSLEHRAQAEKLKTW